MKMLLYSSHRISAAHREVLQELVGKPLESASAAAITNAADVETDAQGWVKASVDSLGCHVEIVDLRPNPEPESLRTRLSGKDLIWLCGGNQYYLRWILRESGADEIIRELVTAGTVFAGWSAGAVVAGPTLRFMEHLEDLGVVPDIIPDGLNLTDAVVLPHFDMEMFAEGMRRARHGLEEAGFRTVPLGESQALLIDGSGERVL
jgi:dipeptidase E